MPGWSGRATILTGGPGTWDPTVRRRGEYAAVSFDPADPKTLAAWIANAMILSLSQPFRRSLPAAYLLLLPD